MVAKTKRVAPRGTEKKIMDIADGIKRICYKFRDDYIDVKNPITRIINDNEAISLLSELDAKIKGQLEVVFGAERQQDGETAISCLRDCGLIDGLLTYEDVASYSDAVIYNYWSQKGELTETLLSKDNKYRDNLFYKGTRWSIADRKRFFYDLFNPLKDALDGTAPVDFFTKYGVDTSIGYLKIISDDYESLVTPEHQVVRLPNILAMNTLPAKTKALRSFICKMKEASGGDSATFEGFINDTTNKDRISKLRSEIIEVVEEAINDVSFKKILENCKEVIINGITKSSILKKRLRNEVTLDNVLKVIVLYQFYDIPYDIHMFLPSKVERQYSCLIITCKQSSCDCKITHYHNALKELSCSLNEIPKLENDLWKKCNENVLLNWRWRRLYDDHYDRYNRLSSVALNLCEAICNELKIETFGIPNRVKSFESFFNKLIARANERDVDFPSDDFLSTIEADDLIVSTNPSWATLSIDNKKKYYREKFRCMVAEPVTKNAEYIFGTLKDMVGLRIITVFNDDFQKIIKQFNDLGTKGELYNVKLKEPSKAKDWYRTYHITFSLGPDRLSLFDMKELGNKTCEVQIRTIFDQGLADVSHKLFYKPGLPSLLKEKFNLAHQDELREAGLLLKTADGLTKVLKNKHDNLINR